MGPREDMRLLGCSEDGALRCAARAHRASETSDDGSCGLSTLARASQDLIRRLTSRRASQVPAPMSPRSRTGSRGSDQAAKRSAHGPLATARRRLDEVGAGLARIEAALVSVRSGEASDGIR